jgi:hypothetical protein
VIASAAVCADLASSCAGDRGAVASSVTFVSCTKASYPAYQALSR